MGSRNCRHCLSNPLAPFFQWRPTEIIDSTIWNFSHQQEVVIYYRQQNNNQIILKDLEDEKDEEITTSGLEREVLSLFYS